MAITYNAGTNTITVVGYTEAVPCNFTDLYNVDKAGTLSLHARTGITAADGAAVAVDWAERPTDYIVLGGASNDLYIVVANWNGTNATIRITGTDRDGAAQTEDIVVNANGTYYTTKWFKTITHTQVTAAAVTSFDYDLTQGQWGVVSRQCTNQFCIAAILVIGDGSTVSWFADEDKQIIGTAAISPNGGFLRSRSNGYLRLGKLDDAGRKTTTKGCSIICASSSAYPRVFGLVLDYEYGKNIELYGCSIIAKSTAAGYLIGRELTNFKAYNCHFKGLVENINGADLSNILFHDPGGRCIGKLSGACTLDQIEVTESGELVLMTSGSTVDMTITDSLCKNISAIGYFANTAYNCYLIDVESDVWTFNYSSYTGKIYRQYEFDLKVIDKDNAAINAATVKIWDKDSNLIVDTTTNASGVIATQTITRGYYNEANGNTLQEASPHLIKITKAGYTTYEADFTLEDKTGWLIALQTSILRNPSMTGGMV